MPLVKQTLEQKLKTRIKSLQPKLEDNLISKQNGLYRAQFLVDKKISDNPPSSGFDLTKYKNNVWEITADEWAKVLSKQIIELIANDISSIVADEITAYIKTASVITPPGQSVTTATPSGPGQGSTTSPSSPATIT